MSIRKRKDIDEPSVRWKETGNRLHKDNLRHLSRFPDFFATKRILTVCVWRILIFGSFFSFFFHDLRIEKKEKIQKSEDYSFPHVNAGSSMKGKMIVSPAYDREEVEE